MRIPKRVTAWILAAITGFALTSGLSIAQAADEKPFAEHKIVLQISDNDPTKQTLILNVASNVLKAYGTDKVDIEIVAFGPGVRLMFAENVNKGRISGLSAEGVRFAACNNTIANMTKNLGHEPAINPNAVRVGAGVVRILELTGQGYTLIKP
jgi:intracellular sulfur oxidation DsrE/DsrF family protein